MTYFQLHQATMSDFIFYLNCDQNNSSFKISKKYDYFCNILFKVNMKQILISIIFLLGIFSTSAQQLSFSDSAKVSLITCSPGEEVYEKFGHTAIRVFDKRNNIDVVFNYGIFDFETSNFYFKFINGETDYQLGVYDTGNFLASYAQRNSIVWEQTLNMTLAERKQIINLLLLNYQPENRVYRYNFVNDNCATRPRDKILSSINGYTRFESDSEAKTYRQLIGMYTGTETWLKFGIDIVFGIDADHFASTSQAMFLPENLMNSFQTAQIVTQKGQSRKLISNKKILINKREIPETSSLFSIKPYTISIFLLIIGVMVTIWDLFRHKHYKLFDSLLLIVTGLAGIIVSYMMFFSIHPFVKMNLNILWLNPLNLIAGILLWVRRMRIVLFFYQIFNILLLVGGLLAFALSVQTFNIAFFPIIVLLLIRSTTIFDHLKRRIFKRKTL